MLTSIFAWLAQSWVGEIAMLAVNWYKERKAAKQAAADDMSDDLQKHAGDGQASVEIRDAYNEQMEELQRRVDDANKPKEEVPNGKA